MSNGLNSLTDQFGSGFPVQTDCKLNWWCCPGHWALQVWEEDVWESADTAADLDEPWKKQEDRKPSPQSRQNQDFKILI